MDEFQATESESFKEALSRWATGVTILASQDQDGVCAMVASSFMSVSLEPPLIAVSIGRKGRAHSVLTACPRFTVNILAKEQRAIADGLARRLPAFEHPELLFDTDLALAGAIATLDCKPISVQEAGDHELILAQVERVLLPSNPSVPLLYHARCYASIDLPINDSILKEN